jgi:hypothetical protein
MDAIQEQAKKPLVVGIAGLILGLILGLVYAWVINPVEWTDAPVSAMRVDLKEDYLRMAIDSYSVNQDVALAQLRFNSLGEDKNDLLTQVTANPDGQSPQSIAAFTTAVTGAPVTAAGVTPTPAAGQQAAKPARSRWLTIGLPLLCILIILAAAVLFYLFFWRNRDQGKTSTPAMEAQQAAKQAEWTDYARLGEEPPMVQFMASYKVGDDLFDDSFSIDSPAGEFLGECGVGISETVGVGEPKKVTAFEVWLFDKNDIQTVTKVLMSAHAYLDEATRQRLVSKGDPVLVETGGETVLETQTLRLVSRVVDMAYGEGAMPEQSFFDRLILELAVWPKS